MTRFSRSGLCVSGYREIWSSIDWIQPLGSPTSRSACGDLEEVGDEEEADYAIGECL